MLFNLSELMKKQAHNNNSTSSGKNFFDVFCLNIFFLLLFFPNRWNLFFLFKNKRKKFKETFTKLIEQRENQIQSGAVKIANGWIYIFHQQLHVRNFFSFPSYKNRSHENEQKIKKKNYFSTEHFVLNFKHQWHPNGKQ